MGAFCWRLLRVVPVKTKSPNPLDCGSATTYWPVDGAVHRYHTEPPSSALGSPGWTVASMVVPFTTTFAPVRAVAFSKLSFAGADDGRIFRKKSPELSEGDAIAIWYCVPATAENCWNSDPAGYWLVGTTGKSEDKSEPA